MINLFNYIERPSPIHKLTGASKLIALLMFSISTMTSFYTPFLAVVAVIAAACYFFIDKDEKLEKEHEDFLAKLRRKN